MISAISSAASALDVESFRTDVTANNVANINTAGFKRSSVSTSATSSGGVQVSATAIDFSQGALAQTGNPNNLSVLGPGFFQIQGSDGTIQYARNVSLSVDSVGYLRSGSGYVLGSGGPIRVPANYQSLDVSSNGTVSYTTSSGGGLAGSINLAFFTNASGLTANDNSTYSATEASGAAQVAVPGQNGLGTIAAGAVEMSNTDFTTEIVNSILSQRASEANVKTIQTADQMLRTLIGMKNG